MLSTLMHCFITLCLGSIMWVLFGYSLSFGPDVGGVIWESFMGRVEWEWELNHIRPTAQRFPTSSSWSSSSCLPPLPRR